MPGVIVNEVESTLSALVSTPSAVIALIGTAPIGDVNTLTLVQSPTADSVFGLEVTGFSIPKALTAIRKQEPNANVLVVNIADASAGTAQTNVTVTNESKTLVSGAAQLAYAPEGAIVVKDATLATTYTLTTDYTISATGALARNPSGAIGATDTVKVTYSHLPNHTFVADKATLADPPYRSATPVVYNKTKSTTYVANTDYTIDQYGVVKRTVGGAMTALQEFVVSYEVYDGAVAADIIGTASPVTGLYCYASSFANHGFEPTIWICPELMELTGVLAAMRAAAPNVYGGQVLLDAPSSITTVAALETARGAGSGSIVDVSDPRVLITFPHVNVFDIATNANELRPMSPFFAGMLAKVDRLESPARTVGNYPSAVIGVESLQIPLTFDPDGSRTTDCSRINDVDCITIKSGMIFWGDRSSAYRDSNAATNKYNVRRVADILKRSLIVGSAPFIGQNITKANVDAILMTGQAFMDTLKQKGWILDGRMIYNVVDNPSTELALGRLTIGFTYTPLVSIDTLTFKFQIRTDNISELLGF